MSENLPFVPVRVAAALAAAVLLGPVATPPLAALTAEEVVARHLEARGGEERWRQVESMRITGRYTAFSKTAPFTLHRQRQNQYHFDSMRNESPIVLAYDGETAWTVDHGSQLEWPHRLPELSRQVLRMDTDFATPFFGYRERGFEVALSGRTQLEGQEVIELLLTRPDGWEERWYLDPESYLEVARDSQGSDFGQPAEQRTFFDDFREVEGLVIPHYVESQWYTRHRVLEIEDVELGVEVDGDLFRMPPPEGMERLLAMAGEWRVKVEQRSAPSLPWTESEREATIESLLRGALLREHFVNPEGTEVIRHLTYDRFRKVYRLAEINDFTNHLDLREGTFDDRDRLTLSNSETGTPWLGFGLTIHTRETIAEISEDGFRVETEFSFDGGQNWGAYVRRSYTPRPPY